MHSYTLFPHYMAKERKENGIVPFSIGLDALGINVQLAVFVLDELMKG